MNSPVMDTDLFFDEAPAARRMAWRDTLRGLSPGRWFETLKMRLAVGALAGLFAGMAFTAWYMGDVAEAQLIQRAREREHVEALRTAKVISRRIVELQRALQVVGEQLDRTTLQDPLKLAAFFEQRPVLRSMFANVFATGADGRVRMLIDPAGTRTPLTSIADREYFKRAVATRLAVISEPIRGRISNEPVIMLVHPVSDAAGVWGVIGGSLRLASRDLIEDLADTQVADLSTTIVVSDAAGRILAHPQRTRLLDSVAAEPHLAAAVAQWKLDAATHAFESGTWIDAKGLVTMAGDASTGWRVWRTIPRDALIAPLVQARSHALQVAALFAVVMAGALGAFIAWQLRPLARLEHQAAHLLAGDEGLAWPDFDGEIGQLARTLRHLLAERAQVERFNAQVLQKLSSVLSASPVGLAFTRHQRFELVSAECCRLLGRSEEQLVGQLAQVIYASNEDYVNLGPLVGAAFADGQPYVGEWQLLRADGTVFWACLHARPVSVDDPSAGTIWSLYDVSEQVQARRQLEHAADHDPLTGVVNRKGFGRAISQVHARQPDTRPASVLMIDLDHFKPINDTAGHAAGDAMLKAVAQMITSQVRASDTVARLGGDEFAVLLPGCDQRRALQVADKVQGAVADLSLTWEGRALRVGTSIGVAELTSAHDSDAAWLAAADAACYAAKHGGRGRVCAASPVKLVERDRAA
ncbi:diguanylate cyclase with PAS/PAC sensor [Leptothrix cholodnii SP-6]|uniref:Diguanylate cyclase with PAS/PAC sensor n=1 Tax=Leptothrix cholodnii (strain ATCC 51168 / LMG 8142 / SP-6) TaxID=395495 RepID=B1Y115_LEPCP|nr:diguanylate cyclase [Leptothrix cholodnii]ACB35432.1 diguanylate cyclase with PAS/PAC sensor [Leptothrix cholodnii SP-6]